MLAKLFIVLTMFGILAFLGRGLYYLITGQGEKNSTVISLSWRIGLSLLLFFALFFGFRAGLIAPHGILPPSAGQQSNQVSH